VYLVWSPQVKIDYWKNIEYLEINWTENEVTNFINTVDKNLKLLLSGIPIYRKTDYRNIFSVPILKQITLFYRIQNDEIQLLRFWNNYQDINNLELE